MYAREVDLVEAFGAKSSAFLGALLKRTVSHHFLFHEYDSYFGVADIVLGTFNSRVRRHARTPVNPDWVGALASLVRGHEFSLEEFQQSYGVSRSNAVKRLREYEYAGFLTQLDDDIFRVDREYKQVADLVVSVEAKLRDWRKALHQAQRYRRFSDLTFVLLDGSRVASAVSNLEAFKRCNVGLVSLTGAQVTLHFVPSKNPRKFMEYYLRVSEAAYRHFI